MLLGLYLLGILGGLVIGVIFVSSGLGDFANAVDTATL